METLEHRQKRDQLLRGLTYSIGLLALLILILLLIFFIIHKTSAERMDQEQFKELDFMDENINLMLSEIDENLYQISSAYTSFCRMNFDIESREDALTAFMLSIVQYNKHIDQLRILDLNGVETIRINRKNQDNLVVVPPEKLQDKSSRYYVKDTFLANPNEIYMSPLDLNIEHGQLEIPYKPMIRFGLQLLNEKGQVEAIVLLNYLAKEIFDFIEEHNIHQGDKWYLLNADGYYLHSSDAEKDFGFMFPEKQNLTFWRDYPDLSVTQFFANKVSLESGTYYGKIIENKQFVSGYRIATPRQWRLIMHIPKSEIHRDDDLLIKGLLIGLLVFGPILVILGLRMGKDQIQNQYTMAELKRSATQDELTGLPNRRKVIEFLSYQIELHKRRGTPLSLVYIDLNNLKVINDQMSHHAGDKMIHTAAMVFKSSIRTTDMAARIGGDEFLVIIPDSSLKEVSEIMNRAMEKFLDAGNHVGDIPWTFCWGAVYCKTSDTLESIIARADKEMYEMKKKSKDQRS